MSEHRVIVRVGEQVERFEHDVRSLGGLAELWCFPHEPLTRSQHFRQIGGDIGHVGIPREIEGAKRDAAAEFEDPAQSFATNRAADALVARLGLLGVFRQERVEVAAVEPVGVV